MENFVVNIETIHGNFDFKVNKVQFENYVTIESECLFDVFKLDKNYLEGYTNVYQNETGIHLFDYPYLINFDNADTIASKAFIKLINILVTDYN